MIEYNKNTFSVKLEYNSIFIKIDLVRNPTTNYRGPTSITRSNCVKGYPTMHYKVIYCARDFIFLYYIIFEYHYLS